MHCYYHPHREAVGVCKSCTKGLCSDCAIDLSHGLACRGHCEERVQTMINLFQKSVEAVERGAENRARVAELTANATRTLASVKKTRMFSSLFGITIGAVFVGVGYFHELDVMMLLGGVFIFFAGFEFLRTIQRR